MRVCRYALRPPVARDRLRVTDDGQVRLALRHRWTDGTTHVSFAPAELLGRLAVLVPRPRINLILYHGVLGPRAAWRSAVVRCEPSPSGGEARTEHPSGQAGQGAPRTDTPDAAWRRVPRPARAPPRPIDRDGCPLANDLAGFDPCS